MRWDAVVCAVWHGALSKAIYEIIYEYNFKHLDTESAIATLLLIRIINFITEPSINIRRSIPFHSTADGMIKYNRKWEPILPFDERTEEKRWAERSICRQTQWLVVCNLIFVLNFGANCLLIKWWWWCSWWKSSGSSLKLRTQRHLWTCTEIELKSERAKQRHTDT